MPDPAGSFRLSPGPGGQKAFQSLAKGSAITLGETASDFTLFPPLTQKQPGIVIAVLGRNRHDPHPFPMETPYPLGPEITGLNANMIVIEGNHLPIPTTGLDPPETGTEGQKLEPREDHNGPESPGRWQRGDRQRRHRNQKKQSNPAPPAEGIVGADHDHMRPATG
jgi:hypothetical protein